MTKWITKSGWECAYIGVEVVDTTDANTGHVFEAGPAKHGLACARKRKFLRSYRHGHLECCCTRSYIECLSVGPGSDSDGARSYE